MINSNNKSKNFIFFLKKKLKFYNQKSLLKNKFQK